MPADDVKLSFGCYYAKQSKIDSPPEKVFCKPLTQGDLMEGWVAVLPKRLKKSTIFNWNVTLSQLPNHLWARLRSYFKEGKESYRMIKNNIYNYNITMTLQDKLMIELNKELHSVFPNIMKIQDLYRELKPHVGGWLMMRAAQFLKNH